MQSKSKALPASLPVDKSLEHQTYTPDELETFRAQGQEEIKQHNAGIQNGTQATRGKRRELPTFSAPLRVQIRDEGIDGTADSLVWALSIAGSVPDLSPSLHNRQWGTIWGDGFQTQHRHARGCVLAIPFDEASGQLISDRVNHYQGTVTIQTGNGTANTRWITASDNDSYFGNCFQFTYGNDYFHLNTFDTATLPQQISYSIWIKGAPNSNIATGNWVFQGYNPNNGKQTIYLEYDNNYPNTAITQIQAGSFQTGAASVNLALNGFLNYWFHVVCTMDATVGTTKLYLNGELMGTSGNNGATSFPASELWFGNAINSSYPAALGGMKDFRIYNRLLTLNEIQDLYRYPDELYEQSSLMPKYSVPPEAKSTMQEIWTMTPRGSVKYGGKGSLQEVWKLSGTAAQQGKASLTQVWTETAKGSAHYSAKSTPQEIWTETAKGTEAFSAKANLQTVWTQTEIGHETRQGAAILSDVWGATPRLNAHWQDYIRWKHVVTMTATATVKHNASKTLTDIVTLTATGKASHYAGSSLSERWTLTDNAIASHGASGTLTERFSVTATGIVSHRATGTLQGVWTITPTARATHNAGATLQDRVTLTATGKASHYAGSSLSERWTLTDTATAAHNAIAALSERFTLTATGKASHYATGTLRVMWTITGTGKASHNAGATLPERFTLTATGQATHNAIAHLSDIVTLTATGKASHYAKTTLQEIVTLTARALQANSAKASLQEVWTLTAGPLTDLDGTLAMAPAFTGYITLAPAFTGTLTATPAFTGFITIDD